MIGTLVDPFVDFAFMRRALAGTLALSLGAPPVGVFLTLRRMSLMSDAMSHAILPGAAAGFLVSGLSLPAMTLGGLAAGLVVALLAGLVARRTVLGEDSSLAAFYLISLASGVVLVSLRGSNVDLLHLLFGSVLALDDPALILIGAVSTVSLGWLAACYRFLVVECVDPGFLRLAGRGSASVHLSFLCLVVLNLVAGFQALGTLLAVGLMLLPAVTARFWTVDLAATLVVAVGLSCLASVLGLLFSFYASVPSGPAIILVAGALYLLSLLAGRHGSLLAALLTPRHLRA